MRYLLVLLITLLATGSIAENKYFLPKQWHYLESVLDNRVSQTSKKMKIETQEIKNLVEFLNKLNDEADSLIMLQKILPKTTLEILISIYKRGVATSEAKKIAAILDELIAVSNFHNVQAFDENTSHIIGKEWNKIDYSGENMTWQKQKQKYVSYKITNFKTAENLVRFFRVESKLPYYQKIYQPR